MSLMSPHILYVNSLSSTLTDGLAFRILVSMEFVYLPMSLRSSSGVLAEFGELDCGVFMETTCVDGYIVLPSLAALGLVFDLDLS